MKWGIKFERESGGCQIDKAISGRAAEMGR